MRRLAVLALSAVLLTLVRRGDIRSVVAESAPPSFAGGQPLVTALYYPWYDEGTWNSGMTADQPLVPSTSYGTLFLDLTRRLGDAFRLTVAGRA